MKKGMYKVGGAVTACAAAVALACTLGGCIVATEEPETEEAGEASTVQDEEEQPRFQNVYWQSNGYYIWVDTETGVQYLVYSNYNKGGVTVLVDAEGKPLLAEGY